MKKYYVYGKVVGTIFLGEVTANSESEAEDEAEDKFGSKFVSFCHHCADQCEDPAITDLFVEEV